MHSNDDVRVFLGVVFAQPENPSSCFSCGEIVELLPSDSADLEAFCHGPPTAAITIDHVVELGLFLVEDVDDEIVFSDEDLVRNLDDSHRAVPGKGDDVIET